MESIGIFKRWWRRVSASWLPPTIAACAAGAISFLELATHRRGILFWRVAQWISLRLIAHGATAAISYAVLMAAFGSLSWFKGAIAIVVSALCGPAIFRSQLALLGSGQESPKDAPAAAYRRVLASIDVKIMEGAVVAESAWVVEKAIPAIQNVPLAQIEGNVQNYLTRTGSLKPAQRKVELDFLRNTMEDAKAGDDDKRSAIVHRLLGIEARQLVVRLVKKGRATP
jgi:hypothetical protein